MAEAHSSPELPPDILFCNILPRLPAKSLPRFMCVSKQWHSFLKTPLFEKLHIHHATNDHHQNHHKFLIFSGERESQHTFNASDCKTPDKFGLKTIRSFPFEANSERMTVLTSFGGLVCVAIIKGWSYRQCSDLILWNPLTGEYKTLSKPSLYIYGSPRAFGLYYSSCDDDYKLLCVTYNETYGLKAYVYSLKSDTWRMLNYSTKDLKRIATDRYPPDWLWPSVALKGKLYFLKYEDYKTRGSIIRFDTKTEKFTEILTPSFRTQYQGLLSLTVVRGCIHLFVIYYTYSYIEWQNVECWVMDEDGNWVKEVALPKASYIILEPLHLMSNGMMFIQSSVANSAWKLDLTGHVNFIEDISWYSRYPQTPERRMYIPRGGKYIETLVSPNRRDDVRQLSPLTRLF